MNNRLWVWGYVLQEVPGIMPFVNQETYRLYEFNFRCGQPE